MSDIEILNKIKEDEIAKLQEENKFLRDCVYSCRANIYNFIGILDQISFRLSNQILGNVEVLKHVSARSFKDGQLALDDNDRPIEIQAFQSGSVDLLINNPVQLILGRFNGLKKGMVDLKNRLPQELK